MQIVCINLPFPRCPGQSYACSLRKYFDHIYNSVTMTEVARQPSVPDGDSSSTLRRYVHVPETKHERMSFAVHGLIQC